MSNYYRILLFCLSRIISNSTLLPFCLFINWEKTLLLPGLHCKLVMGTLSIITPVPQPHYNGLVIVHPWDLGAASFPRTAPGGGEAGRCPWPCLCPEKKLVSRMALRSRAGIAERSGIGPVSPLFQIFCPEPADFVLGEIIVS